ncbi:MAG: O-antigen ligase family protein [Desulfobacterales bacterium]
MANIFPVSPMLKIIRILFFFTLIFSPLSFGGRSEWSFMLISASVFSGFLLFIAETNRKGDDFYQVPGVVPLMLFIVWIFIQIIPIPAAIIELLSPETMKLYQETIGVTEPVSWASLSINKKATVAEFFRYSTYAVFYILSVQLLSRKTILRQTVQYVVILSAMIAFLAILQYFLSDNKIYWFRTVPDNATPFGPYIYHNHYAGFMEMVFPFSLALFLYTRPRMIYGTFRERTIEFFNHPRGNMHLLFGLAAVIVGVSIFLSYSRGGIISLCLSMSFLGIMLALKSSRSENRNLLPFILVLILFSVGWFGWDFIFERFEKIRSAEGFIQDNRLLLWRDAMGIINRFPITGTGFGTFLDIYPGYRTVPGKLIFDHAHNDYIELLTDGGLIGTGLFFWFFVSVLSRTITIFRKRREYYSILITLCSMAGIVSILFHSIMDFNLQNGANGLYFFFLLSIAVAASHTRIHVKHERTYLAPRKKVPFGSAVVFSTGILLVSSLMVNIGSVAGKYYFSMIKDVYLDKTISREELEKMNAIAKKASLFDPLNAQYYFGIGNIEFHLFNRDFIESGYRGSIFFNPAKGEYLQHAGLFLSWAGKKKDAEKLLKTGIKMDVHNAERYKLYGVWLVSQGRSTESFSYFKKAMILDPGRANFNDIIAFFEKVGAGEKSMQKVLPESAEPYLFFADYLAGKKNLTALDSAYDTAARLLTKQENVHAWHFIKICDYLIQKGREEKALKLMWLARERIPENALIRLRSGDLYLKVGIRYRAVEEYQKALSIDPAMKRAKQRLEALSKK